MIFLRQALSYEVIPGTTNGIYGFLIYYFMLKKKKNEQIILFLQLDLFFMTKN